MFTDTHTSAVSPETKLLSAFKRDTEAKKVYLAGRGESAHFIKLHQQMREEMHVQPLKPAVTGLLQCNNVRIIQTWFKLFVLNNVAF